MKRVFTIIFILFNSIIINPISFAIENNKNTIFLEQNKNKANESEFSSNYILGPGDVLDITFLGLDIFNGKYPINPEGSINLPELNSYIAEGKTVKEINEELEFLYKEFIIKPEILIFITTTDLFLSTYQVKSKNQVYIH